MTLPFGPTLRQPDQLSCGASCVVVAGLLRDPGAAPSAEEFDREVLAAHRRLTGIADARGMLQMPWPRKLGTPPWAVENAMTASEGVRYRTRPCRVAPGKAYDAAAAAVAKRPVPFFIGSAKLPRHVVLAIGATDAGLRVYDPASGGLVIVSRAAFTGRRIRVAGWDVPWFVILPA